MSTIIAQNNNAALGAFELARQQQQQQLKKHQPYSSYAAVVAPKSSDSDSESASSLGDDFVVTPFKPSTKSSPAITRRRFVPAPKDNLVASLATALNFLPLKDINAARNVNQTFSDAAARVAPQPFSRDDVTYVRWEPTVVPRPIKLPTFRRPTVAGAPTNFSWRCLNCGFLTSGPRACGTCQAPINVASCRVFLGQLRKDLTAELTSYMLRSVLPGLNVLHVESHTNPTDGRGKGCAWVYVDSVADAVSLTKLHKRVFADVDTEGFEGFWIVEENPSLVSCLASMAEHVGSLRGRPQFLPRQPMVAELPAKSVIAQIVSTM